MKSSNEGKAMSYFTKISKVKGNQKSVKSSEILKSSERNFKREREHNFDE